MRLIDADNLYDAVKDQKVKETGAYSKGVNNALNVVKSMLHNESVTPTIEAVPVVYCLDCEFYETAYYDDMSTKQVCRLLTRQFKLFDFCSYAVKRRNNG